MAGDTAPTPQATPAQAAPAPGKPASQDPAGGVCKDCGVVLRIGVFFDGTNNNKINTQIREAGEGKYDHRFPVAPLSDSKGRPVQSGDRNYASYFNSETNIVHLSRVYQPSGSMKVVNGEKTVYGNFYIDGVGTDTNEEDRYLLGTGGDLGYTSAVSKAKTASDKVYNFVKGYVNSVGVTKVEFDIYGYSRGATSARHFANMVKKLGGVYHYGYGNETDKYKQVNDDSKRYIVFKAPTTIKYIGLFDTVATHGVSRTTKDIPAITRLPDGIAEKKVFQIASLEEHRDNFSLMSVISRGTLQSRLPTNGDHISPPATPMWINEGNKTELYWKGVHADTGGGYLDGKPEESLLASGDGDTAAANAAYEEARRKDPVPESVALEQSPGLPPSYDFPGTPPSYKVWSRRNAVRNDLPIVSLHTMYTDSVNNEVPFRELDVQLPADLKNVPDKIQSGQPLTDEERAAIAGGTHHSATQYRSMDDIGLGPTADGRRVVHPNDE